MNEITISASADADAIRARILTIRGVQVMLDRDLAELYGVPTKALNQAVKRNIERFPGRFMFQLAKDEVSALRSQIVTLNVGTSLRSQIVTLNRRQGQHLKYMPYAFTEQGIAMLSAVLKSATTVAVSIRIMDVFVGPRGAVLAEQAAPRRRRGSVQRAVRRLAHGQGVGQVPRPIPHHRQGDAHPRRRVAEPPRQEVLRVLVARQVQHPGHLGQALSARRRRPRPA